MKTTSAASGLPGRLADLARAVHAANPASAMPVAAPASTLTRASGAIDKTAVAFSVFSRLLETNGLRAAMYSLLRLTDHRFISIFRFQDGMATSAARVDSEDLTDTQAGEVPDTAAYCCNVRDSQGAFLTADAMLDPRTVSHAAREAVRRLLRAASAIERSGLAPPYPTLG